MPYTTRTTCRVCGSDQLRFLFSLGEQYVSDFVKEQRPDTQKVPITLEQCQDCTLVQAKHTAPQDFLYTRHYWYRSGVTQTMRDALRDITRSIEEIVEFSPGDVVVDIGSNDGTLLRSYGKDWLKVGVEPATNLQEEGRKGVNVFINDFWSEDLLEGTLAKVITAIGMFYDLEDPNQFIAGVSKVLADDGVFVCQLMCAKQMLQIGDVGNLAHEHLEFYTLQSLEYLFDKHGLHIFRVEENSVNGGSYRIYCNKKRDDDYIQERFAEEERLGLTSPDAYLKFFDRMERNKQDVFNFVKVANEQDKRVWVYGASTKGNVILQYFGLDDSMIEAAADRSPEKWGLKTVGTNIPICREEIFRHSGPEFALVLPYAFLPEFVEREKAWRERGGKFVVPLPELKII